MNIHFLSKIPQTLYTRITANKQVTNRVPAVSSVRPISQVTDQALKEEGKNEQTKNEATKKEEDKQTVSDLIKKSNRRIISISSLFPWDFFPNTIEVEESRVTFIFRQFLASQSHSVDIKDISNVFIQSSPFFATLQIVSRTFVQNDITIGHLDAKKAQRVKMVIEGLRTFVENNIDTSNYEVNELIAKIEEFHTNNTI
ncbi:hypothetical protein MUP56_00895 [Patescibacteria group bacterium]|nr:hypothetical protein [Patescibacteria group bacterium]